MRRLVILVHRHGRLSKPDYYLREVARSLQAEGVEVHVARGPENPVAADCAFLHVDLTVVPDDHMEFLKHYPVVVNGAVRDISKRHISRLRLHRSDSYEGRVVVKANLNCGGLAEANLAHNGHLPNFNAGLIREYPILPSLSEVSDSVWGNPNLVVERFMPEVGEDGVYRLRMWKFLGTAETNTIAYSRDPIAKGRNIFHREEGGTVPDELRQIRKELGFDFGKFDYGIVDGKVVLYDCNRTPTFSRPMPEEAPRIRAFTDALKEFA